MQGGNLGEGALMFQTLAGPAPTRLRANRTRAHYTPDGLLLARLMFLKAWGAPRSRCIDSIPRGPQSRSRASS